MDKDDVVRVITKVLTELQELSGQKPSAISGNTCPIGDLDAFDSLNGVEATIELSDRLGFELPGVNAFANEEGTKALTVLEVAANICNVAPGKE